MSSRTPAALCNPQLLIWARQSMAFSIEGASAKLGIKVSKLESWEGGLANPSMAQLRNLARIYRRPSAFFYLANPPQGWDAMRDFRRLDGEITELWTPELHSEFRRAREQRDSALEIMQMLGEEPSREWRIRAANDEALATSARDLIFAKSLFANPVSTKGYERFGFWASGLEALGVLVLTSDGVLVKEMRGFSIHGEELPIVMVNGKDAWNGRVFSLLHEYAHLLLNAGGLCDQRILEPPATVDRKLEARCNAIAATILIPRALLLQDPMVAGVPDDYSDWTEQEILNLSKKFGVSAETVLRRLLEVGKASQQLYERRRAGWIELYADSGDVRTQKKPSGDYYKTHVRNLGKGYVRLIMEAYTGRVIDSYTAASFLNAKVSSLSGLSKAIKGSSD